MYGMLPGVESARRRRLHNNGSSRDFISGSSLCLYANRKLQSPLSSSSLLGRNTVNQADLDENLGVAALEAKRSAQNPFFQARSQNPFSKLFFNLRWLVRRWATLLGA
ncbi:hypothetical protein V8G54_031617 [Vigna mungo]|uniref:Uncharacterized protein n=1 Tax=Vigna mungo TaxID=3915 RepID=A0AAQ3MJQ9_VIGMU